MSRFVAFQRAVNIFWRLALNPPTSTSTTNNNNFFHAHNHNIKPFTTPEMALLSTGILLPSSEELDNQLTSADRDPSLRLLINPTLQTILPCLSCKTCNFSLFISHSNDHNCPLPLPGTTAHEIWFQTVIEAWEEWKLYEASRLLWHIPKIQALHDTSRTATVGWTLAWDAVKTGMRDVSIFFIHTESDVHDTNNIRYGPQKQKNISESRKRIGKLSAGGRVDGYILIMTLR